MKHIPMAIYIVGVLLLLWISLARNSNQVIIDYECPTDTLSIYTHTNIIHIDFNNLQVFEENSDQVVKFTSYSTMFNYVEKLTADNSSYDQIINDIVRNSWIDTSNSETKIITKFSINGPEYHNTISKY